MLVVFKPSFNNYRSYPSSQRKNDINFNANVSKMDDILKYKGSIESLLLDLDNTKENVKVLKETAEHIAKNLPDKKIIGKMIKLTLEEWGIK